MDQPTLMAVSLAAAQKQPHSVASTRAAVYMDQPTVMAVSLAAAQEQLHAATDISLNALRGDIRPCMTVSGCRQRRVYQEANLVLNCNRRNEAKSTGKALKYSK